jgi:gliding motility-associated-like protein
LAPGYSKLIVLFFIVFLCSSKVTAQICIGSLGDPVHKIDFDRGIPEIAPAFRNTDYRYVAQSPEDGEYTIAKSTIGMNRGWYTIYNHTPGDRDGYMMIVNADHNPGVFYESREPIVLCPNTTYEFAAWVVNMLRDNGNKPNITFSILSMDNQPLAEPINTRDIPDGDPTWIQYGLLFRTEDGGQVKIRMVNNGPGGGGNDIAIDDITFRPCGPRIIAKAGNSDGLIENICQGSNTVVKLGAQVDGPSTFNYQWQRYSGSTWVDMAGKTATTLDVPFTPDYPPGNYDFRLAIAEGNNLNSPSCRTLSPVLTVRVNRPPDITVLSNGPVCIGDDLILDIAGADGTYEWRKDGNPEVISREKTPRLPAVTEAMEGSYTVSVNSLGCELSASVNVIVIPPPEPAVGNPAPEICEGTSVELSASGGTYYSWSPAEGLSDPEIANPIASPLKTTLYTVKVTSGSCFRTTTVNVIVNKIPKADAGPDKKILLTYHTKLEGKVSGDEIDFFWTPSTGLDDPRSLNPIASPGRSTTYTLNVVSRLGCITAIDEVFVKVYEKLIVPNVFSPNGDGINDSWNITAIDAFDTSNVKIMNRYGEMVFESSGYTKAWDGKYKNNDLPAGVYYYIIKLRADIKPVSGSVTLIR